MIRQIKFSIKSGKIQRRNSSKEIVDLIKRKFNAEIFKLLEDGNYEVGDDIFGAFKILPIFKIHLIKTL